VKRNWIPWIAAALLVAGIAVYSYRHWAGSATDARDALLTWMPSDASAVLYADAAELRGSPFAMELYRWLPQQPLDADYAQFLRDTGFDYERDLDRLAIATLKSGTETHLLAIAQGRFDHQKIALYATRMGAHTSQPGREGFTLPPANSATPKFSFAFLKNDLIALTDALDLPPLLAHPPKGEDAREWRARFERLAGSPLFAVIRQDAAAGDALASQAPGGLRSPELSALLDQLQWITVAGKPEGDRLRIVAEGESAEEATARQLTDLLNGVLVLAQAGLNGPKTRQQLDPRAREAYLEILRSADVQRLDRGETRSVRLVFDVTPKFLEVVKAAPPAVPAPPPAAAVPVKKKPSHKGPSHKQEKLD
jgi:hypothetical protein